MKSTAATVRRHAHDIRFLIRQAQLAAETAEYGAPNLKSRLLAQKLADSLDRLKVHAAELEEACKA